MGILLTQSSTFIIGDIAKILGYIMNLIYEALSSIGVVNIGLCIILFTVIIYTLMLPLTIKQQKFSRLSAVMNPEIQKISKKYQGKKDQASMMKMQEETKLVYEKYGTSTASGCLGSVIQLPILFALWPVVQNIPAYVSGLKDAYLPLVDKIMATDGYQKIMEAFGTMSSINISPERYDYTKANTMVDILYKFRESNWDTLAEKMPELTDTIRSTENTVSNMNLFLGVNIAETPSSMFMSALGTMSIGIMIIAILIPVLSGFTQWLSIKLSQSAMQNRNSSDDNPMMQQMNTMMKIMPLFSVFLCFTMPAGLGLYWIASAVVRTIQQFIINKQLDKKPIEQLVKENMEKAAKKRANKHEVESKTVSTLAHKSTKNINDVQSVSPSNGKAGSLASKANMVRDFNKKNNK